MTVTKSGPEEADCGDDLSYTITIENSGNLKADNVSVTDNFAKAAPDPKFTIKAPADKNILIDGAQISIGDFTYADDLLTINNLSVPGASFTDGIKTNGKTTITINGTVDCQ